MKLEKYKIDDYNSKLLDQHQKKLNYFFEENPLAANFVEKLKDFQIAIASWAFGTGGTRFGRFSCGGEPGNLKEKIDDIGLMRQLNQFSGAISLHIP